MIESFFGNLWKCFLGCLCILFGTAAYFVVAFIVAVVTGSRDMGLFFGVLVGGSVLLSSVVAVLEN